MLKKLH